MWRSSSASADPLLLFLSPHLQFLLSPVLFALPFVLVIPSVFSDPLPQPPPALFPRSASHDGPFLKTFPRAPVQSVPRRHSALNAQHEHQPSIQSVFLRRPSLPIYRYRLRCPRSAGQIPGRWLPRCPPSRGGPAAVQSGKGNPRNTPKDATNTLGTTDLANHFDGVNSLTPVTREARLCSTLEIQS
jgi:hypothetical protein